MSFSLEVKKELSKLNTLADKKNVKTELLGYMATNNVSVQKNKIKFSTESEYNINRFGKLLNNLGLNDHNIKIQRSVYSITINKNYIEELTENKIKDIHEILTENIFQGGIYRSTDVTITGATHTPPTPNDMYNQLKFFYEDLKENSLKMNPIELAAWTHAEFVRIHPFPDGNGRTARLIMNYQLMQKGFLPINIKVEDRIEYYNALDIYATQKNLKPFINLIYDLEEKRLDEINLIIEQQLKANNIEFKKNNNSEEDTEDEEL